MIRPPPKPPLFPTTPLSRPPGPAPPRRPRGPADRRVARQDPRDRRRGAAARKARRQCPRGERPEGDRKSTRLNSSHSQISYAVFCLKKKKKNTSVIYSLDNQ